MKRYHREYYKHLLKKSIRERGHRRAYLLDEGPDHALVEVVREHLLLEAGQTREGDLVQPGYALLCVDLVP